MARYIEQGKSIFIPFRHGVSITDSQLHLRMYKTVEMFDRYGYACGEVDELCEYAPVVRCKNCKHRGDDSYCPRCVEEVHHFDDGDGYTDTDYVLRDYTTDNGYCELGERKDNA